MRSIAAFTASVLNASRRNCLVVALTVITLLATITGCSGGGGGGGITNPVTVSSVSMKLTPASGAITMGQTLTCSGTVTYSDGSTDSNVSYTATDGTITSSGVFTPTAVGAASCTATAAKDSSKSATAAITVTAASVTVTSVSNVCSPTAITTAQTSSCVGTATHSDGSTNHAVSFTLTTGSVGSVAQTGVYSSSATGTAIVTATSTEDATKSGNSGTITVSAVPVTVTSVSNTATPSSIQMGQTSTCLGTVTYSNNTSDHAVSYTATGGTITSSGVFTPTAVGAASCTATSTMDATKSFTATITVTAVAPPAPTITATPAGPLNQGQSTTIAWNANAGTGASANISGPNLTTSTALTGSVSVAPPTGTDTYTITATNAGGSASASVTVTVNAPAPTASLTCTPTSVTLGNSVSCTIATTNATQVIASSTDGSWTGSVTLNGTVSVTPTSTGGSVTYSINVTGSGGSATASSGTITVVNTAIQLTSIVPAVKWVVGQGGYVPFTFYGANLNPGITIATNPDANVQYGQSQFDNSEAIVYLGIDQIHEGAGWRTAQACKSAGTGCSASVVFGLYGPQVCDMYPPTGEKFCLNPEETVAGQHVVGGVPESGYVDKFTSAGAPDGKFFVGEGTTSLTVEPVTGFVSVDGGISDQNGGTNGIVFPKGGQQVAVAAVKAKNDWICFLQPTATLNLSCYYVGGAAGSQTQVISITVGTNPQALDLGVVNGNTYVFVVDAGNSPALYSVQVTTTALTIVNSQPLTGVTAGFPGGSQVNTLDTLGVGVVTSFGDAAAIPFSETTLKTSNGIALPGVPVNSTASTANGVVIVGNADQPNAGGNFTEVNPVTGTATAVASAEASTLPVWLLPATTGKGFFACPQDGVSSCSSFTLP